MPRESSSVWVLPTMSAPVSTRRCTTGALRAAGACSASQSGLPAPVTWPATSNRSFAAKVRPASGPCGAPFSRASEWVQNAFSGSRIGGLFASYRFHRRLVGRQAGKLGKRDRLHRRAQTIIADLRAAHTARLGHELRHGQAAEPALARPHAAAQEGLQLIGPGAAERDRVDDLLGIDLLAAADQGRAARPAELRRRPIEQIEKRAPALETRERSARRLFLLGERRLALERADRRDRGEPPAGLGGLRSGDPGTVAGKREARYVARSVIIEHRNPARLRV